MIHRSLDSTPKRRIVAPWVRALASKVTHKYIDDDITLRTPSPLFWGAQGHTWPQQ